LRLEPVRGLARLPKAVDGEMGELWSRQRFGQTPAASAMGPDRKPQQGISSEERVAHRLPIAGARPELRTVADPRDDPAQEPQQNERKRVIEPDDRIRPRPHQLERARRAIVPVHDPLFA